MVLCVRVRKMRALDERFVVVVRDWQVVLEPFKCRPRRTGELSVEFR
jgi:hypothetical protein